MQPYIECLSAHSYLKFSAFEYQNFIIFISCTAVCLSVHVGVCVIKSHGLPSVTWSTWPEYKACNLGYSGSLVVMCLDPDAGSECVFLCLYES